VATFYITCRTLAFTPGCRHEHVASVHYHETDPQDPQQDPQRVHSANREEMIALLKKPGNEAFTYARDSSTAPVRIRRCSRGIEYLTSAPDNTKRNNLDELPFCSW
jgi:hypothetical protein